MPSIGIYHGDEDWVLKGIGQDLARSFRALNVPGLEIQTTDQVFKKIRLKTDFHLFVQQGQLNENCSNNPEKVPEGSICLFTHLDIRNFKPRILHKCKYVIFNSSIQLSQAIANGYNPINAVLKPHAVDPDLHRIISEDDPKMQFVLSDLHKKGYPHSMHSSVGFCGRYWDKSTYTRRKNYDLIKLVICDLLDKRIPVLVVGPGWKDFLELSSEYLVIVETKYKNYPYYYNLMRVFSSLSIHEGGPLPLLESMCCGVYPVVTNTGFASDIISDKQHGTIVSPFDKPAHQSRLLSDVYFTHQIDTEALRGRASKFSFSSLSKVILKLVI